MLHSDPENFGGGFILNNGDLRDDNNVVTYTLSGLVPFTLYMVRVTTHNVVSDQDPDNDLLRRCQIYGVTLEGGNNYIIVFLSVSCVSKYSDGCKKCLIIHLANTKGIRNSRSCQSLVRHLIDAIVDLLVLQMERFHYTSM